MSYLKILFSIILIACLAGCRESNHSYDFLMQHPKALQKEMIQCQFKKVDTQYCKEVKRAESDFSNLISERQDNPEHFGEKILLAQSALGVKLEALQEAQKKGDKNEIEKAQEAYKSQQREVRTLLAVVGSTSMEGMQ